jgi:hypothetical protein
MSAFVLQDPHRRPDHNGPVAPAAEPFRATPIPHCAGCSLGQQSVERQLST